MTTMQAVKAAAAKLKHASGDAGSNDSEHEAAIELLGALDTLFAEKTDRPAFRVMMQDGLDWVSYTPAQPGESDGREAGLEGDGRAVFREFHGRKPRAGFRVFLCHHDTRWDGVGGYTVPRDGWKPVRVL